MKQYFVYILKCSDNSYYTGMTNNPERRFTQHQTGINKGCYTYNRRPVEVVFCTEFNEVLQAIAFEKQVKGWSRKKKEAIIENRWEDLKKLSRPLNDSFARPFNLDKVPFDSAQGDSGDEE